jgi:hypothetical protein
MFMQNNSFITKKREKLMAAIPSFSGFIPKLNQITETHGNGPKKTLHLLRRGNGYAMPETTLNRLFDTLYGVIYGLCYRHLCDKKGFLFVLVSANG